MKNTPQLAFPIYNMYTRTLQIYKERKYIKERKERNTAHWLFIFLQGLKGHSTTPIFWRVAVSYANVKSK